MTLRVDRSGLVTALYDECIDLPALGALAIARAGRVEPGPDGLWRADLSPSGGPVFGPFRLRSEALAAEVAWLEEHRLVGPG